MSTVLAVNAGSSSLRLALFDVADSIRRIASAHIDRIGEEGNDVASHVAAFALALESNPAFQRADALGHRIVRGGLRHHRPEELTPALVQELGTLASLDPDHLPQALAVVAEAQRLCGAALHVACFDTAFHRTMRDVAQMYPLPRRLFDEGVRRFGFHGLSCESIVDELRTIDPAAVEGRLIVAHLGSGASLTAIVGGRSIDTTMGFSPTGGIAMGTRSGDLDPSVVLYLMETERMTPEAVRQLLNQRSGLKGVSARTGDMRELLEREASDPLSAAAVELFCYVARKHLGALAAIAGGLNTLVFTGGIGEHAAVVRERISAVPDQFRIEIDPVRNAASSPVISSDSSRVTVRVMATDEEQVIARHVHRLMSSREAPHVPL